MKTRVSITFFVNAYSTNALESSFVSLDDLDNISILLHEDNDLEEEITHLFRFRRRNYSFI